MKYTSDSNGTVFNIFLSQYSAPPHWIDSVAIDTDATLIVVDDDQEIHDFWKNSTDRVVSCFTFSEFEEVLPKFPEKRLFIFDFDLGAKESGVDLIEKYNLVPESVLISSRSDDPAVEKICREWGLRVFPKHHLDGLEIVYYSTNSSQEKCFVMFEDDTLYHFDFEVFCQKRGIDNLKLFDSPYIDGAINLDRSSIILIDLYYNNSMRNGLDVGMDLFQLGFRNLFLHTCVTLKTPYWFKGKIDKGRYATIPGL